MQGYKDFSLTFLKTQILKTPVAQRMVRARGVGPWDKSRRNRGDLLKRLADTEQKHDFYSNLYKQYTVDLLRLAIFARTLLNNRRVREYLEIHHPTVSRQFVTIIDEARG